MIAKLSVFFVFFLMFFIFGCTREVDNTAQAPGGARPELRPDAQRETTGSQPGIPPRALTEDPGGFEEANVKEARAEITSLSPEKISGQVTFRPAPDGMMVTGRITGLKPNSTHGFHIHQYGSCAEQGKAAGEHFNPLDHAHGAPSDAMTHAGDMGNIEANGQGVADIRVEVKENQAQSLLNSIVGRAVIVHRQRDDLQTQPSGDSGERIACGVIGITADNFERGLSSADE